MVSIGSNDGCKAYVDVNFYQYLRKQLSAEETAQLEAHTKVCMHCLHRAGLFSEALTNQTSLNTNEKLFFLKFFESELWEIISTELKEEILEEIAGKLRVEIRKDLEKNIQLTKEENAKKPEKVFKKLHRPSSTSKLNPIRQIIVAIIAVILVTAIGLAIFSLFEQKVNSTKSPIKFGLINLRVFSKKS